ncbi:MAG: NADPH-dependent oxidoreductase [Chloroflexota bacterium]
MQPSQAISTPVTTVQKDHVTIRSFLDKPIEESVVQDIINAARRSPTSSNMQTYSIMVVRDPEKKKKLAVLAGNQKHIETCPVFFAFCADLWRLTKAIEMHGNQFAKSLETTMVSVVDASLVGMSAQTAAESHGLGGVMIGGMRNHPQEVGEILGLPKGVFVVYGLCIGWPDQVPDQKPRLPEALVVHHERYNQADPSSLIEQHDKELAAHYEAQGRNQDAAAWSGPLANRLQNPRRPELRATLEGMGFVFE